MKKYVLIAMAIIALTSLSTVCSLDFDTSAVPGLNVTSDVDGAFSASQAENKTLMIVFDQDNCVYCDIFKSDVLSNPEVQSELDENYIVLLVDINRNPDIADEYDVYGTPATQFIDSDGHEIHRIEGYVDSDEFLKALKEI